MTLSERASVLPMPGASAVPSATDRLLLYLWVFSYAALLQTFYLIRRFENARGSGTPARHGM